MSKRAEIAAREAYPDDRFIDAEYSSMCRGFYQEGYEQAEKDLALTPGDIRAIRIIIDHLNAAINGPAYDSKEFYKEVLRRFNEYKAK